MHDVARLTRVEADKRARVNGMTRAQWGMLLRLSRKPGISQKELADAMEVEPITVARMVDRLEAAGLVERRADEQDRRIWRLHLREAAMGMLTDIQQQRDELARFITDGVTPTQREAMVAVLLRMKANLLHGTTTTARHEPAGEPGEKT
ncbi:MarR family winged helix-turn-helix transcriptional regulator [Acidocella aromatica]|uniref:DNA-binding MarR family transcriptional regulator n=1 Tax=Acidocella aromatica TaxID=1303579 RepID=A0A840VC62_9PROT|nr:MarR family transcriptional regulator [Acidocella aromatica]MBB5373296.1 DNA-binding MarR family transcriptional regulator [Acidocella aromatica]